MKKNLFILLFLAPFAAADMDIHGIKGVPSGGGSRKTAPKKNGPTSNLFCSDPFAALCEQKGDKERRERLNEKTLHQNFEVHEMALRKMGPKFDLMKSLPVTEKPTLGVETADVNRLYKGFLRATYDSLYSKVEPPQDMERVRQAALAAVDAQHVAASSAKEEKDLKEAMKAKINDIHYVTKAEELINLANYDAKRSTDGKWDPNLLIEFERHCGMSGMANDSFYNAITNSVIFCPGLLSRAMDDTVSPENGDPIQHKGSFLWLIAGHETGHALGAERFPVYQSLNDCFASSFAQMDFKKQGQSAVPSDYFDELDADFWAGATEAQMLHNAGDPMQALETLRGSAESYCDLGFENGEGGHVGGNDRLAMDISKDEELLKVEECDPPNPGRPICTFAGLIKEPTKKF